MAKCDYCGCVDKELWSIMNPNMDDEPLSWNVCIVCKEVIMWQQKLSFASFLSSRPYGGESADKMMKEAQENLERIARETKIPIMSAQISKQKDGSYDVVSVEYTGKGNIIPLSKDRGFYP